jgi:hypothetical protein
MQTWNHPELCIYGPTSETSRILSIMVDTIRNGGSYREPGTYAGVLQADARVGVRRVHPTQSFALRLARSYLREICRREELEAIQVFWPDEAGKFPYEDGCDLEVSRCQPRLDVVFLQFTKQWEGCIEDEKAIQPDCITSTKGLAAVWKAWKIKGDVPELDFTKEIVVAAYWPSGAKGAFATQGVKVDDEGNLTISADGGKDLRPSFHCMLGAVSRDGVKTVNKKGLPME